jgi:hypothetical protein
MLSSVRAAPAIRKAPGDDARDSRRSPAVGADVVTRMSVPLASLSDDRDVSWTRPNARSFGPFARRGGGDGRIERVAGRGGCVALGSVASGHRTPDGLSGQRDAPAMKVATM